LKNFNIYCSTAIRLFQGKYSVTYSVTLHYKKLRYLFSNIKLFHFTKNDFPEISKNLAMDLKIILLNYQNYYVKRSSIMNNAAKNFDTLAISLGILYNYFNNLTKLFSDLYLAKFLDILTKPFFTYPFLNNKLE